MPSNPTDYVKDLLARLDSREELPQTGPFKSSKDTVSYHAHREAEKISDTSLIPALLEQMAKAKKSRDFQKLAIVLGGIAANTKDPASHAAYKTLMERTPRPDHAWLYLLEIAKKADIAVARPFAFQVLEDPQGDGLALSMAINYLGTRGNADAVPAIGRALDADCDGLCNPMRCVVALREIGHKDAIPYLQRAAERHAKSRKKDLKETRDYAKEAMVILSAAT